MWSYLFIILLILIAGYLLYCLYVKSNQYKNNDFIENNEYKENIKNNKATILLFYAQWCPHSNKVLEKMKTIETLYKHSKYELVFNEIDCEEYPDMADSYNIEEYPTIILVYNSEKYVYDAELDEKTFDKFINTIIN
jgi:thiol-disulfide isomerase/thioredoxin